ncbi:MAG TPA: serine protease, partial [Solirubrobacteraceae bacterium]|nr:serine protease [Solirubrobacteraceae bacterium]
MPWQVGLIPAGAPAVEQYCGGALIDDPATAEPELDVVVTAAHCVDFVDGDQPGEIEVIADVVDLGCLSCEPDEPPSASIQERAVTSISSHPDWNVTGRDENDAAVLKLDSPFDPSPGVGPLPLAADAPAVDADAIVSGWGALEEDGPLARVLNHGIVDVLDDSGCDSYGADFLDPLMLCANRGTGDDVVDACAGDSGGPLALGEDIPSASELVGIVSTGLGCAREEFPGIYTQVDADPITAFLDGPYLERPHNVARPAITGTAVVGETLTCSDGTWTGAEPMTFTRVWRGVSAATTGPQYTVREADQTRPLSCSVRARNDGGSVQAVSNSVTVQALPAPAPPPAPPEPPAALPPPAPPPPPAVDTTLPVSRFSVRRCVARRCRLVLLVSDLGGVDGARVRVTMRRLGRFRTRTLRAVEQ